MKHGKKFEIKSTDKQYTLVSQNMHLATVNGRTVFCHHQGSVEITIQDSNLNPTENIKLPSSTLTITLPKYMILRMHPYNNWALTIKQTATIIPELYSG